MDSTVSIRSLVQYLSRFADQDQAIVWNAVVAEDTDLTKEAFYEVAEYLETNQSFNDDSSDLFLAWIQEANDVLISQKEGA